MHKKIWSLQLLKRANGARVSTSSSYISALSKISPVIRLDELVEGWDSVFPIDRFNSLLQKMGNRREEVGEL